MALISFISSNDGADLLEIDDLKAISSKAPKSNLITRDCQLFMRWVFCFLFTLLVSNYFWEVFESWRHDFRLMRFIFIETAGVIVS